MESTEKLIKGISYVNMLNHMKEIMNNILKELRKSESQRLEIVEELNQLKSK